MLKQTEGWCKQAVLESLLILRISRKVASKKCEQATLES